MLAYFWIDVKTAEGLETVTHLMANSPKSDLSPELQARVKTLQWRGGQCQTKQFETRDNLEEEFANYWPTDNEYDGIAIDEFVWIQPCITKPAADSLRRFRELYPDQYTTV